MAAEAGGKGEVAERMPRTADIHPVRMLEEVKNFAKRDAILCVDGQETLNFGRQTMPTFSPGHRLQLPFGTMGVGLPFAIGAKIAWPDVDVIVARRRLDWPERDGDETSIRQASDPDRHQPERRLDRRSREKPGRDLGYAGRRGDGEYITQPEDIRPALIRGQAKVDEGMVACINVRTDYRAR